MGDFKHQCLTKNVKSSRNLSMPSSCFSPMINGQIFSMIITSVMLYLCIHTSIPLPLLYSLAQREAFQCQLSQVTRCLAGYCWSRRLMTVLTDLPVNVGCNGAAGSSSGSDWTVVVALITSTTDTPAFQFLQPFSRLSVCWRHGSLFKF